MNGENPCQLHTTHVGAVGRELYGSSTTTCARKADHGLVYVCPLLFKSLSFENSELNCSTAEVAHKLFCVKLSGLISELKILEKSIYVGEYSTYGLIFGLFLKIQRHKKFRGLLFFLAACNEKFKRANAQPFAYTANEKVNKAGGARDSQARTREWINVGR